MEPPKSELPKLQDMVMCGDHPSFTKTELNVKESKFEDKDKENEKDKISTTHSRISPTASRAERVGRVERAGRAERAERTASEHAGRRRVRSVEPQGNRTLLQAALGSFRWPPYLVAVWVLMVVLTHVLHCLVGILERALPTLKKFCQYFRVWTEESWKGQSEMNHRLYPAALACVTGLLYTLYYGTYAVYSIVVWSIEPLCSDVDEKQSSVNISEAKVTNYLDDVNSNTNFSVKQ